MTYRALLTGIFLTLGCLALPPDLRACMADCSLCGGCSRCEVSGGEVFCDGCANLSSGPTTLVKFLSETRALIVIQGYKTTNLHNLNSCVTALSPVEGVERVNSIVNVNSDTGRRFNEVTFSAAATPGLELAALAREAGVGPETDAAWHGFLSRITGAVRDNTPNHFVVDVTLKKGTDPEDFLRTLRQQGVFVTSSSNRAGVPDRGHQYFRRLGVGEILIAFPFSQSEGRERRPRQ